MQTSLPSPSHLKLMPVEDIGKLKLVLRMDLLGPG